MVELVGHDEKGLMAKDRLTLKTIIAKRIHDHHEQHSLLLQLKIGFFASGHTAEPSYNTHVNSNL
jgi:hypothetical protein